MVRIICRVVNVLIAMWQKCRRPRKGMRGGYIYFSWRFDDSERSNEGESRKDQSTSAQSINGHEISPDSVKKRG